MKLFLVSRRSGFFVAAGGWFWTWYDALYLGMAGGTEKERAEALDYYQRFVWVESFEEHSEITWYVDFYIRLIYVFLNRGYGSAGAQTATQMIMWAFWADWQTAPYKNADWRDYEIAIEASESGKIYGIKIYSANRKITTVTRSYPFGRYMMTYHGVHWWAGLERITTEGVGYYRRCVRMSGEWEHRLDVVGVGTPGEDFYFRSTFAWGKAAGTGQTEPGMYWTSMDARYIGLLAQVGRDLYRLRVGTDDSVDVGEAGWNNYAQACEEPQHNDADRVVGGIGG